MQNHILTRLWCVFASLVFCGIALLTPGFAGKADAATNVYYSVGQNTNDHKTGLPTVTISAGIATFSIPQTALNMGVGDRVTYNTTSTAYISGKISQAQWTLATATGSVPADVTDASVDSIRHEFNSLANAVTGASDSTHLATTNFVNGNYVLNIPCYYDSGPDTTAVDVVGYTTGADNFIKIYTPYNLATEVNRSQRHTGKWTENAYRLEVSSVPSLQGVLVGRVEDMKIDGLQIFLNYSCIYHCAINLGYVGGHDHRVNNCIMKGRVDNTAMHNKGINAGSAGNLRAWNNIIYDISSQKQAYGISTKGASYVYNNTIVNVGFGVVAWNGTGTIAKNNIVTGCGAECMYGTFATGTDYNATSSTSLGYAYTVTGGGNVHDRKSQVFMFRDEVNRDLHLAPNDVGAKNQGVNLSTDANIVFNADIDHQTRPSTSGSAWDIGADEFVPFRIAYHDHTWYDGPMSDEHWAAFTHNIHHIVTPVIIDSTTVDLDTTNAHVSRDAAEMVSMAHANGQPILIAVGNSADMATATDSAHLDSFVNALMNFITTYHYDGIDIDWEGSIDQTKYSNFVNALRTSLDAYAAPLGGKGLLAAFFGPVSIAAANQGNLDYVNVSCYDNFDWNLSLVWHNNALYDPNNMGGGHSCQLKMQSFVNAGVPHAKLGVGIPFYGWKWTTGSDVDGNGPYYPGQILTTPATSLVFKWYREILKDPLFIPANQHRDTAAGNVPYLSVNAGGSNNVFLTYDDATSVAEKYNFTVNNGYGGVCVWTEDYDYIATGTTAAERHPLAEALREAAQ